MIKLHDSQVAWLVSYNGQYFIAPTFAVMQKSSLSTTGRGFTHVKIEQVSSVWQR